MQKNVFKTKQTALLTAAVLAALSLPVYAAEEPVETRNVIVTATRTEQEIKDTPMAVEVITQEQIQAQGATTLRHVLENATGISLDVDGMKGGRLSIRGSESRHVLLLIDGKRISTETGNSRGNTWEIDRLNLNNVERVEIVRGSNSAMYGSDAMGGVVNIITKRPDKPQVSLDFEGYKADAFKDGHNWMLRYDAGQQGRFGWSVDYGQKKEDPFVHANGDTNNYYGTRRPFNFQGVWKVNDSNRLVFDYGYMKENIERISGTTHYINEYERTNYSLGYEGKTATTDYQLRVYRSIYDKDYEARNKTSGDLNSFDVLKRTFTVLEGNASKAWGDNHFFTYGGEYRKEEIDGTRINSGKNNYTLWREGKSSNGSEAEIDYYAAYVQDEWTINDRWLLISALRFDDSNRFGSAVSPKLGATYKIHANSRLKANIGYGFKTPTSSELYTDFAMGSRAHHHGNPNLDPEKAKNYELSWEGERGSLAGKVTYFRNDVKNLIALEPFETIGNVTHSRYQNIEKAQLQGGEAEISKAIGDKITAKLSYVYLDAQDKASDMRLPDRSRHQISTSLLYHAEEQGISASLRGTWHGDHYYTTGSGSSKVNNYKSYWLWNMNVNKELDSKTTVYFGVDNIFNERNDDLWLNGAVYRTGVRLRF